MPELRIAYLAESNRQHAFPIDALLRVRQAPVFTTAKGFEKYLRARADVHVHPPHELGAAMRGLGIDIVLSTSQLLTPALLRGGTDRPRCVFVGHGESDKTHDAELKERFVHNPANEQFDLLLLATHAHFRDQRNRNKRLIGYLKHDLFLARGYATRATPEPRVLWAPGWGRHNSARHFTSAAVEASAALGIPLDVHLHPHSYSAEPEVTRSVQVEMLRYEHVRVIQCADILEAMAQSSVMLTDVSSVAYDYLFFDRPLIFLDHPGLSLPEEKRLFDVGVVAQPTTCLRRLLADELGDPGQRAALRRQRLAERFFSLDGHAAERALAEVTRVAREEWSLLC